MVVGFWAPGPWGRPPVSCSPQGDAHASLYDCARDLCAHVDPGLSPSPTPKPLHASPRPCHVLWGPLSWSPSALLSRCLTSLPAPWILRLHSVQASLSLCSPGLFSPLPCQGRLLGELAPHPRTWASQSHHGLACPKLITFSLPNLDPTLARGHTRKKAGGLPRPAPFSSLHTLSWPSNSECLLHT